jgi:acyl carrier protein
LILTFRRDNEMIGENITDEDIKKKLKIFIIDKFLLGDDSKILGDDESFLEKGIIDSTGVLELVGFIDETFKITVEDEELIPDNLDSLNKLTSFIKKKVGYVS